MALLPLALLAGCGTSPAPTAPVVYPNLTGNWQIQTSSTSPTNPSTQVLLTGALQNSGASVSGTLRFANLANPANCTLNQVVTLSGTTDVNRNLNLTSPMLSSGSTIKTQLTPSATVPGFYGGTIEVDGGSCAAASAAALGVEIEPVTGTFNGPLVTGPLGGPITTAGSASLVLSQSSTPSTDGQFAVTGMLSYTLGDCVGSAALSGGASGVGITMSEAAVAPLSEPAVAFLGLTDPAADKIQVESLDFASFSCTGSQPSTHVYGGTLTRQ